jgi:CRP-like cAMP-binding protein
MGPSDRESWLLKSFGDPASAPLPDAALREFASVLREERFAPGSTVVLPGETADRVWIVRSGTIAVTSEAHGRRICLELLHGGDVFGDDAAIVDGVHQHAASAVTDSVLFAIDAATLRELIGRHGAFAMRWCTSAARRLRQVKDRLADSTGGSLAERLASALLREADATNAVPLSQEMLADLLGVRRSSVNRILREFEGQGLVGLAYRRVDLVDLAALSRLAGRPHRSG